MNATTLHAKIRTYRQVLSIGRVQTPTLALIVEPAEGDRQLQAGALLGVVNDIPRHAVHGHFGQVYQQEEGERGEGKQE